MSPQRESDFLPDHHLVNTKGIWGNHIIFTKHNGGFSFNTNLSMHSFPIDEIWLWKLASNQYAEKNSVFSFCLHAEVQLKLYLTDGKQFQSILPEIDPLGRRYSKLRGSIDTRCKESWQVTHSKSQNSAALHHFPSLLIIPMWPRRQSTFQW